MGMNVPTDVSLDVSTDVIPATTPEGQPSGAPQTPVQDSGIQGQAEIQIDPAFANYFDNIYQQPAPAPQAPQQQFVQQFPQYPANQQPQAQPQQVQNPVPAFDYSKLSKDEILEKFDNDPLGFLAARDAQVAEKVKQEILSQLPNVLNPHLQSVENNIELKRTQAEIANTVQGNLAKEGIVLHPILEQQATSDIIRNVDNAFARYNQTIDMLAATGQQITPSLLNNGRRFSGREFAIKYATEYSKDVFKRNQMGRIQGQVPQQYQQPTANPVHSNNFPAVQNGTPTKDLRSMTSEELDNWGRAQGLKV